MKQRTRVTKRLIEASMNRAFGLVVSELRLKALRLRVEKIEAKVPVERLFELTSAFVAGQFGHELGAKELTPVKIRAQRLCAALQKLTPEWNGVLIPDHVALVVAAPKRASRR